MRTKNKNSALPTALFGQGYSTRYGSVRKIAEGEIPDSTRFEICFEITRLKRIKRFTMSAGKLPDGVGRFSDMSGSVYKEEATTLILPLLVSK